MLRRIDPREKGSTLRRTSVPRAPLAIYGLLLALTATSVAQSAAPAPVGPAATRS